MEEEWVEFEALEHIERIVVGVQNGQPLLAGPWKKGERGKLPKRWADILLKGRKIKLIQEEEVRSPPPTFDFPQGLNKQATHLAIAKVGDGISVANTLHTPTELTPATPVEIRLVNLAAEHVGRRVSFSAIVVGESLPKALPAKLKATCTKCGQSVEFDIFSDLSDNGKRKAVEELIFGNEKYIRTQVEAIFALKIGSCSKGNHIFNFSPEGSVDYRILYTRDPPSLVERFDERVYDVHQVHLICQRPPSARRCRIEGWVVATPTKRNLVIIADHIEPEEQEFEKFRPTNEDITNFNQYFGKHSLAELSSQIAPGIVGRARQKAKEAALLVLHSPARIPDVGGKIIPGTLRCMFFGDAGTGKSEILRDITFEHYFFGEFAAGESTSRTGITYTIDTERDVLRWGLLPLNDGGLVVIDGIEKMLAEEWGQLNEALSTQRVVVHRFKTGEAPARTRIIASMNLPKPLREYVYPCLGIIDSWIFREKPRIRRFDLFIPFGAEDVKKEEVAHAYIRDRPIPDEVFKRHVWWVWSRKPEQIKYTEDARREIFDQAQRIMIKYSSPSIPIVTDGFRETLCRISVAFAALKHSTDEKCECIIVQERHVEEAVEWLEALYAKLELDQYVLEERERLELGEDEARSIYEALDEDCLRILNAVKVGPKSSEFLAQELGISDRMVKDHYKHLKSHNLIRLKPHVGAELTQRGVSFVRWIPKLVEAEVNREES